MVLAHERGTHRCGETRGQRHLEVAFESQQSRHENEYLVDVTVHVPMLGGGGGGSRDVSNIFAVCGQRQVGALQN